jgi:hypothetical protein
MGKTRQKANLTSDNLITSNIDTDRIGINSSSPTATLDVGGNVKVSGVITSTSFVKSGGTSSQFLKGDGSVDTSTYISSVGIQSAGISIGNATTLNFVGSGNTFSVNGSIIDVSISGGGGGGGAIGIQSGGTEITASASTLNFVGTGITMADDGSVTDITIPTTTRTVSSFTATNGQTEFTGLSYDVGYIDVYLNGAKLDSTEYTASNGTSVTLTTGASTDDIVETVAYDGITVVDLIGLSDVVDDTTPQLGGNLDLNSKDITGTGNFNVTGIVTATTLSGALDVSALLKESVNITAGKLSDNTNIDLANGMVHLFTTTETATSTPNIRYDASNSLDSKMDTGESITVVLISAAAAAGYSAELTIDGSAVTEEWLGGSAPTTGGTGGYDVYTYNIIKTESATFVVLANLVNFA